MVCKSTSIKKRGLAQRAFTLVEFLVSMGLTFVAATALATMCYYTSRSFAAILNYSDMSMLSRMALDKMTHDIHANCRLTAYATNAISLQDQSNNITQYNWDKAARTLVCLKGGKTNLYLMQCDAFQFWIFQHTTQSNLLTCATPAVVTNARLVQMTWSCSRLVAGKSATTETVESTKIALRNY